MKADFSALVMKHKAKRICVMGGAPSLAEHYAIARADVYISTNAHGCDLRVPDYVLAMDEHHKPDGEPMGHYIRARTDAPIISPHRYADYQLMIWPQAPRSVLSGMVAVWAAWMMGAKLVLVAGCDGYGGDSGYVHESVKMARDVKCPVRVLGDGPLTKAWPAFDPAEKFGYYKASTAITGWLGEDEKVHIRVLKPTQILGLLRDRGEEMNVMRHEVKLQLRHRMIEEI